MTKSNLLILLLVLMKSVGYNQTVTIGNQVWSTKNLDVTTFRNGDLIPQAKTDEEWIKAGKNHQPAWCYYNNDPKNGEEYGKLYNWYAVDDPRGLVPKGWHLPNDAGWTTLTDFLGGQEKAGSKMKSNQGWFENGNGTNNSGFSGLPGGYRYSNGTFTDIGKFSGWWSSSADTEDGANIAWCRRLSYNYDIVYRSFLNKEAGMSVRCLRD